MLNPSPPTVHRQAHGGLGRNVSVSENELLYAVSVVCCHTSVVGRAGDPEHDACTGYELARRLARLTDCLHTALTYQIVKT